MVDLVFRCVVPAFRHEIAPDLACFVVGHDAVDDTFGGADDGKDDHTVVVVNLEQCRVGVRVLIGAKRRRPQVLIFGAVEGFPVRYSQLPDFRFEMGGSDHSDGPTRVIAQQLILKRASKSRPSGEWNEDDYHVRAERRRRGVGPPEISPTCVSSCINLAVRIYILAYARQTLKPRRRSSPRAR